MPIKLPKLPRRKSAGNVFDEISTPAEPSFRVLERPSSDDRQRRLSQARALQGPTENTLNPDNRVSGATHNSTSSAGQDSSSFSGRFSSSSTLPSSTDLTLDDKPFPKHSSTAPVPPLPQSSGMASLRNAGRAFSFGRKKAEVQAAASRPSIEHTQSDGRANYTRDRAYTETSYTSESTATPPQLLGSSLGFSSTDDFGRMFDGLEQGSMREGVLAESHNSTSAPDLSKPLPPGGFTPTLERTFSYEGFPEERINFAPRVAKSNTMPLPGQPINAHTQRSNKPITGGPRRTSLASKSRLTSQFQDDDADLVMNSIAVSKKLEKASSSGYHDSDEDDSALARLVPSMTQTPSPGATAGAQQYQRISNNSPSPGSGSRYTDSAMTSWQSESAHTTPRARKPEVYHQEERSLFDSSPPHSIHPVAPRQQAQKAPQKPRTENKIMTRAQFERYRKEQEMNQSVNPQMNEDDSGEDADEYEDDDEAERNRQIIKQRRKQEAHLAVYRQQMMKVTREQPLHSGTPQLRPSLDATGSGRLSMHESPANIEINFEKITDDGKVSEDEDEDVPLGVLAAHGFPSKTRPPTAMSGRESKVQYRSESYPAPPASASGASHSGRASILPPFAKHLPHDPYYGASLVNPSNRESPGHNQHSSPSIAGSVPPGVPPSGLVGVIADEERARAVRRGSPNAQAVFTSPLPPSMNGFPGQPPPMMSAGERATVQMSEQMGQMMQMQMQWMQQMQQMMASGMQMPSIQPMPFGPGQSSMMVPPTMSSPSPNIIQYPGQSGSASFQPGDPNSTARPPTGRGMSMMSPAPAGPWPPLPPNNRQSQTPSMMNGGLGGPASPYAPSIAPSERSNVGMPSRYRPVSVAPSDGYKINDGTRSSTMNSNSLRPGDFGRTNRLSSSQERKSKLSLRPVIQPSNKKEGSDDDDEEGWAEMKRKRDKMKLWRSNKKEKQPAEPALEYYDYSEA